MLIACAVLAALWLVIFFLPIRTRSFITLALVVLLALAPLLSLILALLALGLIALLDLLLGLLAEKIKNYLAIRRLRRILANH